MRTTKVRQRAIKIISKDFFSENFLKIPSKKPFFFKIQNDQIVIIKTYKSQSQINNN